MADALSSSTTKLSPEQYQSAMSSVKEHVDTINVRSSQNAQIIEELSTSGFRGQAGSAAMQTTAQLHQETNKMVRTSTEHADRATQFATQNASLQEEKAAALRSMAT